MIITREITGGKLKVPARPKVPSRRDESSDDGDDDVSSTGTGASISTSRYDDEDDASSVDFSPRRHETVYNRQLTRDELRKGSIVSISTTISSTTEYVPPEVHSPTPNSLPNDLQIPTICRGLLLLAQMSSEDNLFTADYTKRCVELARENKDFVLGFIAQEGLNQQQGDNFLTMTPGVSLLPSSSSSADTNQFPTIAARRPSQHWPPPRRVSIPLDKLQGDGKGQQYNTPQRVILEKGVDIIIVGRGIIEADNPSTEAERYRREGWQALSERWRR
jgi:uridine monophosphate synthetase